MTSDRVVTESDRSCRREPATRKFMSQFSAMNIYSLFAQRRGVFNTFSWANLFLTFFIKQTWFTSEFLFFIQWPIATIFWAPQRAFVSDCIWNIARGFKGMRGGFNVRFALKCRSVRIALEPVWIYANRTCTSMHLRQPLQSAQLVKSQKSS